MREVLGDGTMLGYCTNVHAGANLAAVRHNLEHYALRVKARVSPCDPMGVGLWFSAAAAEELLATAGTAAFKAWMQANGLLAYTLNGFPYGDFHRPRVKTRVYRPHWGQRKRLDYTLGLAKILAELLPEDEPAGSISTLPVGWPASFCTPEADTPKRDEPAAGGGSPHGSGARFSAA